MTGAKIIVPDDDTSDLIPMPKRLQLHFDRIVMDSRGGAHGVRRRWSHWLAALDEKYGLVEARRTMGEYVNVYLRPSASRAAPPRVRAMLMLGARARRP